jgi:hypothetical protein
MTKSPLQIEQERIFGNEPLGLFESKRIELLS